jgi:hypothetical protein
MMRPRPMLAVCAAAFGLPLAGCLSIPGLGGGSALSPPALLTWDWNTTGAHPNLVGLLGMPTTSGTGNWAAPFDVTPTVYDLDGDGSGEIIALGNDTNVHVFDSRTGREDASIPTTTPPHWYIQRVLNGVTVGILAPGEPPTLLVASPAANIAAWRFEPAQSVAGHLAFRMLWEHRMDSCYPTPGMDSAVTIASLPDGKTAILVQTEETGIFALNPDGTTLWRQCIGGGNSAPAADDLDGDGRTDAVFASDEGKVHVYDAATGSPEWQFDATASPYGAWPGSVPVTPTIAELDGVPPKEILFVARHAWSAEPAAFGQMHMAIFAIHGGANGTASVLWMKEPAWANPLSYTRLVVSDVDHDGRPDIFGMDWNTVGHYPGNWERLNGSHVFRLSADGGVVWMRMVPSWWSNKDIAVGDFSGSGQAEVLANGPRLGDDGYWRLDAANGEPLGSFSFSDWTVLRGPAVAKLSNDGGTRLLFTLESRSGDKGVIAVVDFGTPLTDVQAGA